MKKRYYAIKDNKIVSNIDIAPFSKEAMDNFCNEKGFSDWFELDEQGVLSFFGFGRTECHLLKGEEVRKYEVKPFGKSSHIILPQKARGMTVTVVFPKKI
jgi:hypothetical protein